MPNPTTVEERLHIVERSEAGLTDPQIAEETGRSVHTVRKWRRRGTRLGRGALVSQMGRPKKGALSSFPRVLRERLLAWRKAHPGWGSKTLRAELEASCEDVAEEKEEEDLLPSRSSIGRFLKEEELITRSYEKHSALPASSAPHGATAPHQLWEMDARGNEKVDDIGGYVALIDLNDRYSRARLLSYPCALEKAQSHPATEDYKTLLRLAFSEWGLPKRIQVDHESVFFDNLSKSPYPSRVHLWLCALGVELCFARTNRPTDQAITERSHQLWYEQVIEGNTFGCWSDLYEALLKRREFLNHHLPCSSLAQRAPLAAFPQAEHSGRFYEAELEKELLDLKRVDRLLAKGRWFRRVSKDSTVSLGGLVYYVKGARKGEQLEISYDEVSEEEEDRHLLFKDEAGELVARKAIKGVSVEELLGEELEPYVSLPFFQPRLPFTLAEEGVIQVCETMAA